VINVGDLLTDPDFAQSFSILRSKGSFALGGWSNQTTTIKASGVIIPATAQELEQLPEGDRVVGMMAFWSAQPLYETRVGDTSGLSDIILWRGQQYRLAKVFPFQDFGYTKAIGARMSGE
jgi:hypothetical protein